MLYVFHIAVAAQNFDFIFDFDPFPFLIGPKEGGKNSSRKNLLWYKFIFGLKLFKAVWFLVFFLSYSLS